MACYVAREVTACYVGNLRISSAYFRLEKIRFFSPSDLTYPKEVSKSARFSSPSSLYPNLSLCSIPYWTCRTKQGQFVGSLLRFSFPVACFVMVEGELKQLPLILFNSHLTRCFLGPCQLSSSLHQAPRSPSSATSVRPGGGWIFFTLPFGSQHRELHFSPATKFQGKKKNLLRGLAFKIKSGIEREGTGSRIFRPTFCDQSYASKCRNKNSAAVPQWLGVIQFEVYLNPLGHPFP